ncbi:glycine-rich domain-containing protein [uncultured Flavobacterium sp.]|uniref:glycine-rich domain-containing protein n=1 Tax=uncultured Flavobacterium sp. TaxID=165435 RepID=UPI0030EC1FF3
MEKIYPNLTIIKSSKNHLITLLVLFFGAFISNAQTSVTFTTSTTWTCPAGISSIQVEAWGGGGGAKNSDNGAGNVTGGGGGGAYARRNTISVVPGTNYTITVGTGGDASEGGATTATFNGVNITAAGGKTGANSAKNNPAVAGGAGGSIANSVGDIRRSGGNGGSGYGGSNSGSGGGGGSAAGSNANGNNGGNATSEFSPGAGGNAVLNFGGAGGKGGNNDFGSDATGKYGGGGGGAGSKNEAGGNGMNGAMIITYLCPAAITITAQAQSSTDSCDYSVSLETNGSNTTWSPATDLYTNSSLTIPYTTGTVASKVFAKPSATTTYTATNNTSLSCTSSTTYEVKNYKKRFITSGDWHNPANWSPTGVPTNENCVTVIQNATVTINSGNIAFAKTVTIESTAKLILKSNQSLIVTNEIKNNSTEANFEVENNASLIQINNVSNTGKITYRRTATGIKGSDYVYWTSPVSNQAINAIYSSPVQGPKYSWNTLTNNGNGVSPKISQGTYENADGVIMGVGAGYLIRGSSSFGLTATTINSTFIGKPNNGDINVPIFKGSYTGTPYTGLNGVTITNSDDNYNLIGNPYPSAINASKFINANSSVIKGSVQLWRHGSDPAANNGSTYTNPFYGTYAYNYSASDYITINSSGTSNPSFSENIKAGQAFFVEMLDSSNGNSVIFNNAQRVDKSGNAYVNDAFYKNSNQQNTNPNELERHRLWLDIKDANNLIDVALVGYIEGATMVDDNIYDAAAISLEMGIYSISNNQSYVIQGRSLPFDDNDQVAIGFNVPTAGTYTIGINLADGLFLGTQDIYLKDESLNIYHDLKTNPYSFTAAAGIHDTRFKLVYKNTILSNVTFNENEIQIVKNRNIIEIVSGNEIMDDVKVYDVRGRLLAEKSKINANAISIDINNIQDQVLIINIVTSEGIKVTRKIL